MISMRRGFVFTVDSFLSLALVLFAIFSLISLLQIPSFRYTQYEQVYDVSRDGLLSLEKVKLADVWGVHPVPSVVGQLGAPSIGNKARELTLIEAISSLASDPAKKPYAGILADGFLDKVIPRHYGYRVELLDASGNWIAVPHAPGITRDLVPFKRFKASSVRVINGFVAGQYDDPGQVPFHYRTCSGPLLPCDPVQSFYVNGTMFGPTLVRLTVWV